MRWKMMNLLLILMLFSCSGEEWLKFTNDVEQYEISYSKTWEKKVQSNMVVFLSPKEKEDVFQENINVMVQEVNGMSLEAYTKLTKKQIADALGSESIVSLRDVELVGVAAKELIYDLPMKQTVEQSLRLRVHQTFFVRNNKAYLLTYTAEKDQFDLYLEVAEKTMKSFKLVK